MTDPLQKEFHTHVTYVFNQVINTIRKGGYTAESAQVIGKMIWRLYFVYVEYKSKSKEMSQKEWLAYLMDAVKLLAGALHVDPSQLGVS